MTIFTPSEVIVQSQTYTPATYKLEKKVLREGTGNGTVKAKSHEYTYDGKTLTFYHGTSGGTATEYELYIDGTKYSIRQGYYNSGWNQSHSTTKNTVEVKLRSKTTGSWGEFKVYNCSSTLAIQSAGGWS